MTTPRRVRPVTLVIAFALLIALLFGMVLAARHQGDKIRFGLVPDAHAFGAAHMLASSSPQYVCTLYDDEEIVLRALDNGLIDAAMVSVDAALKLPEDVYALHGVFAVTDLLAVSGDQTIINIGGLSGRTLILPENCQGSKEEAMLKKLLLEEDCAGYDFRYAANPAAEYAQIPGSVLMLQMDDLEAALQQNAALSVRFRLSQQWRESFLSAAPAGYLVVYRRDKAGTGTFLSFENALRDSMIYSDRKRKKTIAMAVAEGLFASETPADQLIDYMSFSYLEGAEMELSIRAWQQLN